MNKVKYHIPARRIKAFDSFDVKDIDALSQIGIELTTDGVGFDSLTDTFTTPNVGAPLQFLQNWLPGVVREVTTVRMIDDLCGITTAGDWADEEVVQMVQERTGNAQPYGDYTSTPLSSYNMNFEKRTIVRFEDGFMVGTLERERETKYGVSAADAKRIAAVNNLEIIRNSIGFVGFNAGANKTYGMLNDPSLPAYENVPNGAGGAPEWSTKTFQEITADINSAANDLRVQSGSNVDPFNDEVTLAIASSSIGALASVTDFNVSVFDWINKTYPKMRVKSVPEFDDANGGANVFYLYAETFKGDSTDNGRTFDQIVPAKLRSLGSEARLKGFTEGFSNATAGIMVKRPYLVVRRSGI